MTIRPAVPDDADGIAGVYLQSAEQHAALDPERYRAPEFATISARYRHGWQHPQPPVGEVVTLVADRNGEILGFVDVRMERPLDAMHHDVLYCLVAEIAVDSRHRRSGIGAKLLRAAEDWGRERGAVFSYLEYAVANTLAAAFYTERMGYRAASITMVKRLGVASHS